MRTDTPNHGASELRANTSETNSYATKVIIADLLLEIKNLQLDLLQERIQLVRTYMREGVNKDGKHVTYRVNLEGSHDWKRYVINKEYLEKTKGQITRERNKIISQYNGEYHER